MMLFKKKLKTVQYNAALAITGAIKGTFRKKLYQELRLEYLQQIRCMERLCLFCKFVSTKIPSYIYDIIPPVRQSQRHPNTWNKLNHGISSSGPFLFDQVQVRFIISVIRSASSW